MPYKPTGRPPGRPRRVIPPADGSKPCLPPFLWRALEVEVEYFDPEGEPWPSSASARTVADAAGVGRRTIEKRRHDPLYRRSLFWLLGIEVAEAVAQQSREPNDLAAWEAKWRGESKKWRRDYLRRWAQRNWPKGRAVQSPLDGAIYSSPEAYAEHLIDTAFMPWPELTPRPMAKK